MLRPRPSSSGACTDVATPVRVRGGVFESNTYLCPTSTHGECLLVDPGLDLVPIDAALAAAALTPVGVLCTHGHFDHVGVSHHYQERFGIPVLLHRADVRTAGSANFLMMAFKIPARIQLPEFQLVDSGQQIRIGGEDVTWRHTPGHTPGSCVLSISGNAFTGDTLYRDGIGLVSLPGEDEARLRRSIQELWVSLPEEEVVHPGHGGSAPFGEIKRSNMSLRRFLGMEGKP
jgi:hydroxyacylglutathione hydrolase